ncbi:MAG: TetR family transcriptional regulator [Rhizobiales bacterium]|nr:TetR family transcriptional regulator [Hyphomicrobiales bacterium]MBA69329.1 TetR family transcriptional regulator [Hyphomicrobiales bacterium]|tara:strand:- start:782 stop:1363 length:582 start_codon:yes stop_codon:yes gene_type:complete
MASQTAKTRRKPRADSLRNRQKLLEAASVVFGAGDGQASLEAVARQAGVGIGTLYRHFPTREELFEAVYRNEVDILGDLAERLVAEGGDTVEALRRWLHASIRLFTTKSGMIEGLQLAAAGSSELRAYSLERMTGATALLLKSGVDAGQMRDDISPEDIFRALVGIFYSQMPTKDPADTIRLIDVFVDGLRKR